MHSVYEYQDQPELIIIAMEVTVHFKNIKTEIISNLQKAQHRIKIAVAWLSDEDIIRVLAQKGKSGTEIQILISDAKENFKNLRKLRELLKSRCKLFVGITKPFMHNKFSIIDDKIIINGSYNWSYAARNSEENIMVILLDSSSKIDMAFLKSFEVQFQYLSHRVRADVIQDYSHLEQFKDQISNPVDIVSLIDQDEIVLREEFEIAVRASIDQALGERIQIDINGLLERMQVDGGGVEFARRLINDEIQTGDMKSGFRKLIEPIPHRVDLSLEYLVSLPRFQSLFKDVEINFCRDLMRKYGL